MPTISTEALREGDILTAYVAMDNVVIFDAGTVLVNKSIEILKTLGVEKVEIEPRSERAFKSREALFANIDARFSYVTDDELMNAVKYIVKDVAASLSRNKDG